jgi:oligopeptide/dipeptide ABC transporter ATP-binding protein
VLEQRTSELSWGARFAIAMAMALSRRPELLILDDVFYTRDALSTDQWMTHLRRLQHDSGLGLLVLCRSATNYAPLKPVRIVRLQAKQNLRSPSATALNRLAAPDTGRPTAKRTMLRVEHLTVLLSRSRRWLSKPETVVALQGLSFDLRRGELLGLFGASPSGKTALALTLARLLEPTLGRVSLRSHPSRSTDEPRRPLVLCPEDGAGSLDPRFTAGELLDEALEVADAGGTPARAPAADDPKELALAAVGLDGAMLSRRPDEMSLGEAQLVSLARALLLDPAVLILDCALSALELPHRERLVSLLRDKCRTFDVSTLWLSHDIRELSRVADRVGVMYAGHLVEFGAAKDVFAGRHHPYTRMLLEAQERSVHKLQLVLEGGNPDLSKLPSGCTYHPRCPRAEPGRCDTEEPELLPIAAGGDHSVACWHPHV